VDGRLARADIGSASLKAVHFTLGPVNQATEVMIDSPDVMGVVRVPVADGRPIDAKLPASTGPARGPISADPDERQDRAIMDAIPWLTFSCVDCRFGELPLGEVKGSCCPANGWISRDWRCAWRAAPCAAAPVAGPWQPDADPCQGEPRDPQQRAAAQAARLHLAHRGARPSWRWI
jgi:uncharacterized protein YhdP